MGIDFDKVERELKAEIKRQEERDRRKSKSNILYYKIKNGDNNLRFMPPWVTDESVSPNANQIYRQIFCHYGPEDNFFSLTCSAKTPDLGGDCEVCAYVRQLFDTKNPEDIALAKQLMSREKLISAIVDLDDPVYTEEDIERMKENNENEPVTVEVGQTKIQVFEYGYKVKMMLLNILKKKVDISNLKTGWNVVLNRTGKGRENTTYNLQLDVVAGSCSFEFKGNYEEHKVNLDALKAPATSEFIQSRLSGLGVFDSLKQLSPAPEAEVATSKPLLTPPKKSKKAAPILDQNDLYAQLKASVEEG